MVLPLRVSIFLAIGFVTAFRSADAESSPNVVLIVVDDLGYADLSCTGATDLKTPNIDRLAARGVRFTRAYATAPICNASRIAIMSGRYQQRQGVSWYNGKGLYRKDFPTIAEVLKAKGYATGYVGKFHHGSTDHVKGRGFPLNHGFDTFFGFAGGTKHYLHHSRQFVEGKDRLFEGPMWSENQTKDIEGFTTELFGERARDFIREKKDSPFYLHLSFNAVHNFTHQLPADYLKEKGLKGFEDLKPGEDWDEWRLKISYPANPEGRAYYLGQLHFLDLEIGKVLDALDEAGIAEETAIILVGDNGGSLVTYANNDPLKGGKYTLYEGGVRVPMIASIPGQENNGTTSDGMVSTLDLFPTLCDLVGAEHPDELEGLSLLSQLRGDSDAPQDRTLFWDTGAESAVCRGDWKLLITRRSPNPVLQIEKTPKGTFLYNLSEDVGENTDLAAEDPQVVAGLKASLETWKREVTADAKAGEASE